MTAESLAENFSDGCDDEDCDDEEDWEEPLVGERVLVHDGICAGLVGTLAMRLGDVDAHERVRRRVA